MWGKVWESAWGVGGGEGNCGKRCKEVCWGVREVRKDVWGGVWESVWGDRGSVLACGKKNGGGVRKCGRVWDPNTLPHISSLTSPFPTSPLTFPTPQHTFLHLLSYLFQYLPFLSPHPNTFFYDPHISSHLLKVWRSYHVTKFLWRSYCGKVTGNHFYIPCYR